MNNLKNVISKYSDSSRKLGDESDTSKLAEDSINMLKKDLREVSSKNAVYYWLSIGMILVVFLTALILIFYYIKINKPENIQIIFGASGISIGGLIFYMNKIRKEKISTDLLLTLVGTMQRESINSILVALLNKL